MSASSDSATLLREARAAAGLTQRELAERAGTAQCVIARIERGQTSPSWQTLERLIGAAGQRVRAVLEPASVVAPEWLDEVPRIRALSPEARLQEVANLSAFVSTAVRRG